MQWETGKIDDPAGLAMFVGYEFVRRLPAPAPATDMLLVRDDAGAEHVLKFAARDSSLADDTVISALRSRSSGVTNRLHVPVQTGRDPRGRFFTAAPHCPEGSLDGLLAGGNPLPLPALRPLIRHLAGACRQLHETVAGCRFVHRDIKPSNVLVVRRGDDPAGWEFWLADLDTCLLLCEGGEPAGVPAWPTTGYAAPETLRGEAVADPANDYWSFGMLLWVALTGTHPFAGLTAPHIRSLLVEEEWALDAGMAAAIDDEACRALLGGLLRRVAGERWGPDELERWLDGDPSAIVQGLRLLGENAADTPFDFGGEKAFTVGNVAAILLRTWDTDALASPELYAWMERLSPTAAGQLRGLRGSDLGLLEFCSVYYPGDRMPPVWRGEAITVHSVAALSARAHHGDGDARENLITLLGEGGGRSHFEARNRYGDVSDLFRHIDRTREEYEAAWRVILDAGAPGAAPDSEECLIHAALIACTPVDADERREILARLFDPALIMARGDWFFVFGTDPALINPSQLFVLRTLEGASLLEALNIVDPRAVIDPAQLRDDMVLLSTQDRLLRGLFVRPGAAFVTLNAGDTHDLRSGRTQSRAQDEPVGDGHRTQPHLDVRLLRLTVPRTDPDEHEVHLALITWSGARPNHRLVLAGRFRLPRHRTRVADQGRMLFVIHGTTRIYLASGPFGFRPRTQAIRIEATRTQPLPLRVINRFLEPGSRIRSVAAFMRVTSTGIPRVARLKLPSRLRGVLPAKTSILGRPATIVPVSMLRRPSTRLLRPEPRPLRGAA